MLEFDDDRFQVRAAYGTSAQLLERLRTIRIDLDGTLVGRAAAAGHPLQVPDLRDEPTDAHLEVLQEAGWRSLVAVPMLREGRIVGALVVRRRTPGGFSEETCELLQTFAGQSALAILNARLFRELERKSAELEVASRHKSEFLASMSHELRTPLNAVIGFSEVLLERMFGDLNERQDEYLRDIWGSGRHLLELLNDILDLSKVEAGRMDLEPSAFSVADVIDSCLSLVRERAVRHGVTLERDVAADVGFLEADELRFKQVLLNLVSNAVKFTPAGGQVVVRATSDGAGVTVTVADTGVGIAPEDRARIFESFQQGGRGPAQQEGTGLGLTLSKRIVELLGGSMWVDSEVGVGSTFGFTVPLGERGRWQRARGRRHRRTARGGRRGRPLVPRPADALPGERRSAGRRRAGRAGGAGRGTHRDSRRPSCWTSVFPTWTVGTSWRRSRPTRPPPRCRSSSCRCSTNAARVSRSAPPNT